MRKWLIWLAAGCVCLGVADRLAWVAGTHALQDGLDRWETQARAQGWTVSEGRRFISGWPVAAGLSVTDFEIAGGEHAVPGGVDWKTGRTTLWVSLGAPFTLQVKPEGQEMVRLSHMHTLVLNADHIIVRVPLGGMVQAQATLSAYGVTGGVAGSMHQQDVQLQSLVLTLQAQDAVAGTLAGRLSFAATGIGLPDIGRWPLGDTIGAASGVILLSSPDLSGSHGGEDQAAAWRDGGGKLSLRDVSLHWGPLGLVAQAQLGLDARLQPAGKGKADVTGSAATFDALVEAGVIAPGIGATGKAVLSVMPQAPDGGMRLPFGLRDNTLSVGPIPLARLSDVVW